MTDLLGGRAQRGDQLGHNGFHFGVALVQMLGQRAHEDDHALPDRVVARVLWSVLQKLLKDRQQGAHVVLGQKQMKSGIVTKDIVKH